LTRGFLEYAQFRGFIPDPTRVRHPRDKPHVERGVPYVRERLFKGGSFIDLADLRVQASHWCLEVAGQRIHGTTRQLPLQVFRDQEQAKLLSLDPKPYDVPAWARLRVHLDHHIEFRYALYSVPDALCPPGSTVEVSADSQLVRIYHRGQMVKTHPRQPRGGRSTDPTDYPPEKSLYAMRAPDKLRKMAAELGPSIGEFAARLLEDEGPWVRFRQAQKLLALADRYTPTRLEAACARALAFELLDVRRLERILRQALDGDESSSGGSDGARLGEGPTGQPGVGSPEPSRGCSPLRGAEADRAAAPVPARFARPGSAFVRAVGSVGDLAGLTSSSLESSGSANPNGSHPTASVGADQNHRRLPQ
jgi:hypothetical protein